MPLNLGQYSEVFYTFRRCLSLLSRRDRFLVWISLLLSISLVALDTLGVLLIAALVAVATWAVQGESNQGIIDQIVKALDLSNLSPQDLGILIGLGATFALVGKSLLSFYFTKRQLIFLTSRDAKLASELTGDILNQDLASLNRFSSFEYQNAVTLGSSSVTSGLISQITMLVSEILLQVVLFTIIFIFSPTFALLSLLYFGGLLALLTKVLGRESKMNSEKLAAVNIRSSSLLFDSLQNFRLLRTSKGAEFYLNRIRMSRKEAATLFVNQSMLSVWSKYSFEVAILVAGVSFGAFAFLQYEAVRAASLMAVFMAVAFRIAPSLMKIQNSIVAIKGSLGSAKVFFQVRDSIPKSPHNTYNNIFIEQELDQNPTLKSDHSQGIVFSGVSFRYRSDSPEVLSDISFEIPFGARVGLVGPSGAGKSTLVDLLLGILEPSRGFVRVFGQNPRSAIDSSFIRVGYVPQNVILTNESIKANICFGKDPNSIENAEVLRCLTSVGLENWVKSLPLGIFTPAGELGSSVSGGQRQRIGIARALLRRPELLVMDEATSSLDADSEFQIAKFLETLTNEITIITIAHRLSTVKALERLFYISNGQVAAQGSFSDLRLSVPDFDRQATLMGLN